MNDSYGHRVGDSLLIRVANTVSTLVRRHEVLSRLGGHEFAVLVPNASEEDATRLAERVVQVIAEIHSALAMPWKIVCSACIFKEFTTPITVCYRAQRN